MKAKQFIFNTASGYEGFCTGCGQSRIIATPSPVEDFVKDLKAFEAEHADCEVWDVSLTLSKDDN